MDRSSLEALFERSVVPEIFGGSGSPSDPLLVLLSGQPGAGKTAIQRRLLEVHEPRQLVAITGDDLRQFHPDYLELLSNEPLRFPAETSLVSGPLVGLCLDWALQQRRSVLLEGTFRDEPMVRSTVERFKAAGWDVQAVTVAVSAAVARLSAESRFLDAPTPLAARWTPPEAHAASLANAARIVGHLEGSDVVDLVQVEDRQAVIYSNSRSETGEWSRSPEAEVTVRRIQQAFPRGEAAAAWLNQYSAVFRKAVQRPGYMDGPALETYRQLQIAGDNVLQHVVLSRHDLHQTTRRHRDRQDVLDRIEARENRR